MMGRTYHVTSINLDLDLYEKLKEHCRRERLSMARVINRALAEILEDE